MAIDDFAMSADNEDDKRIVSQCGPEIASVRRAAELPGGMHSDVFYDTVCPPLPANHLPADDEPEAIGMLLRERGFRRLARERYTGEQWRLRRWAYARLTEEADAQVGRVLGALIESGAWDDTVVILTSDHGDLDASHKMEHKSAFYQECAKVPLLVKGLSDAGSGSVRGELVSNGLDCACTVLDYAGADRPGYLPGASLRPCAEGGAAPAPRDSLIIESELGVMAVGGRYKYTRYDAGKNGEQFYDLGVNPGEMYNQIGDARYAAEAAMLREAADRHLR